MPCPGYVPSCHFSPQATGYGLLWLLIGFGGIAVVDGTLFARIFDRYIHSSEEG